jgi:hypothetical protein
MLPMPGTYQRKYGFGIKDGDGNGSRMIHLRHVSGICYHLHNIKVSSET